MYQTILHKQISTHLSPEVAGHPEVRALLASVGDQYRAYEEQTDRIGRDFQQCQDRIAQLSGQRLSRSSFFFRTPLASLDVGIVIETLERKVFFINQRFCSLFQLEQRPEEYLGADTWAYSNLKQGVLRDPKRFLRHLMEVLEAKEPVVDATVEMADGSVLQWNYLPIIVEGVHQGNFWEFKDVTKQVRDRQRLAESEARNRLVMQASLDAVIITDETRAICHWNARAQELFGWTAEEAAGKRVDELLHPREVSDLLNQQPVDYPRGKLSTERTRVLELSTINKAGKPCPVELIVVPYQQHGKTFHCKFVRDISYRKDAENRLRAQEQKYRNIITHMNLGLIQVSPQDTVLGANQSFYDLSGYAAAEVVGRSIHDFFPDCPDMEVVQGKLAGPEQHNAHQFELAVHNKAGEQRWWLVSGALNYDDRGENVGRVGIVLDITDQKNMEHELALAKTQAEEASVAKEAFLANMSHEIRTPLNAIIGMIRELGREKLTPDQQTYLHQTDSAARHLLSIVNSILDISKIEAGALQLDQHDFSMEALAANIHSIMHVKAASKHLNFSCAVDPELWPAFRGDSVRLRQILINLVDNAIKFTDSGQVRLHMKVADETADGQLLRISVIDSGIGMETEYLERIFAKFSQADQSTANRFGGTGLGMSITKEIIKLMGGTISVSSEQGVGTKFVIEVRMPRGQVSGLVNHSTSGADDRALEGAHLLLVEDNVMNRFIATKCLSHFGCTVDEACNGREALERLQERDYDLILMDIQMPELDGVETTKIIRGELHLDLPIIAVTANAFKQDIDGYLSIGMNDYVTKPFEENLLYDTLALHLRGRPLLAGQLIDTYDLSQLEALSQGDEGFVHHMVDVFVRHTPSTLQEIRRAMAGRDYGALARAAHRIHPSIEKMGILQLRNVVREIERSASGEVIDEPRLSSTVGRFTDTLERVLKRLQAECVTSS